MPDSVIKPFVALITFFGVLMLALSSLGNIQHSNAISNIDETPTGMEALAGFDYVMYNPTDGYNITWNETVHSISATWKLSTGGPDASENHVVFWPQGDTSTGRNAIWAYIIRNETWDDWYYTSLPPSIHQSYLRHDHDMVIFAQKYAKHLPGSDIKWGLSWRYYVIPLQKFIDNSEGNFSRVSFIMGNDNMTAFITSPDSTNFTASIMTNNTFLFGIGQGWGDFLKIGKQSILKMMGQLLTCSLPDTDYYVNIIITIGLWSAIIFVAVSMISRFIPTIPGL